MKIRNLLIGTVAVSLLACAGVSLADDRDDVIVVNGNIVNTACDTVIVCDQDDIHVSDCDVHGFIPNRIATDQIKQWFFVDVPRNGKDRIEGSFTCKIFGKDNKDPKPTFLKVSFSKKDERKAEVTCKVESKDNKKSELRCDAVGTNLLLKGDK